MGKGLTGGYMTLSATLTTKHVLKPSVEAKVVLCTAQRLWPTLGVRGGGEKYRTPLISQDWQSNIQRIETQLRTALTPLQSLEYVQRVRVLGAIGGLS